MRKGESLANWLFLLFPFVALAMYMLAVLVDRLGGSSPYAWAMLYGSAYAVALANIVIAIKDVVVGQKNNLAASFSTARKRLIVVPLTVGGTFQLMHWLITIVAFD